MLLSVQLLLMVRGVLVVYGTWAICDNGEASERDETLLVFTRSALWITTHCNMSFHTYRRVTGSGNNFVVLK